MSFRFMITRRAMAATALLVAASSAAPAFAVEARSDMKPWKNGEAGLGFAIGAPQGDFDEQVDAGFGLEGCIGYRFGGGPVMLGAQFTFLQYGNETREEPFSTTIPDVRVDVTTSNNIVLAGMLLRIDPARGVLRPYVDAVAGFSVLFTSTTIKERGSGDEVANDTNQSDTVWNYGGGGGLKIRVYSREPDEGQDPFAVFVDLGARYMAGGEAEYLKEGSIRHEDSRVVYDLSRSRTDLVIWRVGAAVHF